MKFLNSYSQLLKNDNFLKKIKNNLKSFFINQRSKKNIKLPKQSIIFPFYHHVFDDEVEGFKIQLKYMQNYGEFISYEDSINLLNNNFKDKNIYFCLSFDDGFKNIFNNVTDIALSLKIPINFFIPTSFIDNKREDAGKVFFNTSKLNVEFLSWNDCKKISSEKIFTISSHSVNHKLISQLSYEESLKEMRNSKYEIENNLKINCNHFAPPVGDFLFPRDTDIVKKTGYKSLSTTLRGQMSNLEKNVYNIKRHHLLANWDINYLKYFFFN